MGLVGLVGLVGLMGQKNWTEYGTTNLFKDY